MTNQTINVNAFKRSFSALLILAIAVGIVLISGPSYADSPASGQPVSSIVKPKFTTIGILVDGEPVVYCPDRSTAVNVLVQLRSSYAVGTEEIESISFVEDVQIGDVKVVLEDFSGYLSVEQMVDYIRHGSMQCELYTVQVGDTLPAVAEKYGVSVEQLLSANPVLAEQKYLSEGQTINVSNAQPLIGVRTVERVYYDTPIEFDTVEEPADYLFEGEFDVKIKGQPGVANCVAQVERLNGVEMSREVLSETVQTAPTTQVLKVGTKKAPPKKGTGVFIQPARSYIITSPYGHRSHGFHHGYDLAMPIGSDVCATDGGVVTFAASRGAYGRFIVIDHGDRKTSCYAHCSELLVKPGDKVFQGQRIALSGNSGRSTGPHLHFEIRIDNIPVNPAKFVDFKK